ncbi:MAG: tRNA (adenosine(37)-N6)-threonylcarbamoyltransferase complex transferase subunit TsaD, partial [Mycoplasma sp.]
AIYKVYSPTDISLLNTSSDDAVGECYDKVSRALGLGYPGGPFIDKLFNKELAIHRFIKKQPISEAPYSFSGLKTAVLNYINTSKMKSLEIDVNTIASSFQFEIIEMVLNKLKFYLSQTNIKNLSVGGGVSANQYLIKSLKELELDNLYLPSSKVMSSDNAGMVGIYAQLLIKNIH